MSPRTALARSTGCGSGEKQHHQKYQRQHGCRNDGKGARTDASPLRRWIPKSMLKA
jgi:hypothetical protein